jgi:2-keto-4-pentenoate hydratase/2-oxohepta-3-ene-1,7-dioic acid hydratase in catechol pathway
VGKNYAAHIEEMASVPAEKMVVFMKPATSIGADAAIIG